jgi:release factor glutamine methyltransferase
MTVNAEPSTSREVLRWAVDRLGAEVPSPQVDAERICMQVLHLDRAQLYSIDRELTPSERHDIESLVERRRTMEPLQYLTGSQGFRRLDLLVGPGVLIPRPETETLVEVAIESIKEIEAPRVLDIGTGSGAIALSIAAEVPGSRVWATDVSPEAIGWATKNRQMMDLKNVVLLESDLFSQIDSTLRGEFDVVVSNPPYLSEEDLVRATPDIRDHEPLLATVAGPTGLEVTQRIVKEAIHWLRPGQPVLIETWTGQWPQLKKMMEETYDVVKVHPDLNGALRVAEGRKRL